jgi:hypothetical protein
MIEKTFSLSLSLSNINNIVLKCSKEFTSFGDEDVMERMRVRE